MIANELQYNLTKSQAARFEQAIARVESTSDLRDVLLKAELDGLKSQLGTLRSEIEEYEALRSGRMRSFEAQSLEELPRLLIQARIARGLTQKQLAERLGIKEQQIQRYESTGYASASLARIKQIAQALNLNMREEATLA